MKKYLLASFIFLFFGINRLQAQTFYGMTSAGGNGGGNLFQTNTSGSKFRNDHSFSDFQPNFLSNVIQASNGLLYGMYYDDGTYHKGVIFSYDISTQTETNIYSFGNGTDGQLPQSGLMQASDGFLYGVTMRGGTTDSGIIFSYNVTTGVETVLHNFGNAGDGSSPYGSLIQASNDILYGTTLYGGANNKGTIFSYSITTGKETDLYDFGNGSDGAYSYASVIQATNGVLYGVTNLGGSNNVGIIFSYNINTGKENNLYSFGSGTKGFSPYGPLVQATDGKLYGLTSNGGNAYCGVIFNYNISTSIETDVYNFLYNNKDVESPMGGFIQANNNLLYGIASYSGGSNHSGAIFSYNITTDSEKVIYYFSNASNDGSSPEGILTQASDSKLYGMSVRGGTLNGGILFNFNTTTTKDSDLYNFNYGIDGSTPYGSLTWANNSRFYGTTTYGGVYGYGTIFSFDTTIGSETDLYDFQGGVNDGETPYGSLIQATNGLLYGMTSAGGTNNYGTIFSYDTLAGIETVLHNFGSGIDGKTPWGSLIQATDGNLYGMTESGGNIDSGAIFSYNISTGVETIIHNFGGGNDGTQPYGSLMQAGNGLIYGLTYFGGTNYNSGTIFSYNISTGVEKVIYNFGKNVYDGIWPQGSLIQASNGLLYGMTVNGGSDQEGTIFSYNIAARAETIIHSFGYSYDGNTPENSLIQASNGFLYGMTNRGGNSGYGVIFSYNLLTGDDTSIYEFVDPGGQYPFGNLVEVDSVTTATFSPVWPGDANDDLIVNNYDLIPIGLYYGDVGYSRDSVTNLWAPHASIAWSSSQTNGYNLKFLDCNGDGIINSDDTLAILQNYNDTHLSHSPRRGNSERSTGGAPLFFVADSSSYFPGSPVHISVMLGNSITPVTNMYGLGYDINVDASMVQPGTLRFNYDSSFLGIKNSNAISLAYIGIDVETAVVGTDHISKNGYGKIGDLYFNLSSSINTSQFLINVSSLMAVDSAGDILSIQPLSDTIGINIATGIEHLNGGNGYFTFYPNPCNEVLTISGNSAIGGVEIRNVLGQQVLKLEDLEATEVNINTSFLLDGIYFVTLNEGDKVYSSKIVVNK